jgi:hypothetical protein
MSNNILSINLDKYLRIEIKNQRPVKLEDLTLSLLAFNHQFHIFIESETDQDSPISTELFIKDVKSGSIIVDLVTHGAAIAPLIWEGGSLQQWIKTIESIFQWLQGKSSSAPKELKKQDLQDWNKVLEPVAKDNGAQLNLNVKDGNVTIYQISIGSNDANAMQNRIAKQLEALDLPNENIHRRKVMYWYQAKFDKESDTGNRAKIDDISGRALKVIFENNQIKEEMLHPQKDFVRPWQDLAYVVDVEVQTVRNEPKVYKVLRYYPEETFDPSNV